MAPSRPLPVRNAAPLGMAQLTALLAFGGLTVWLWFDPGRSVPFFWSGILPLLPALLLLHPSLWRNVCPLASLSMGTGYASARPPGRVDGVVPPLALLLLLIAVRPLGLDESGPATATLLLGLATAAAWGRRADRKAGFCNRFCPLLAVERLYGQAPLVHVENARCDSCTLCTPRACLDLSPAAAAAQALGPERRNGGWMGSAMGTFAAAFPGVIVAFFLLPPSPGVPSVAAALGGGAAASWMLTWILVGLFRPPWAWAFRLLGGLSAALFFYFALPDTAAAWGAPGYSGILRWTALAFVAVWTLRDPAGSRPRSARSPPAREPGLDPLPCARRPAWTRPPQEQHPDPTDRDSSIGSESSVPVRSTPSGGGTWPWTARIVLIPLRRVVPHPRHPPTPSMGGTSPRPPTGWVGGASWLWRRAPPPSCSFSRSGR